MKPRLRRTPLVLGAIVILALLGFVVLRWTGPMVRISPECLGEIKVGMTEAEVIRIVGGPSGDYKQLPPLVSSEADFVEEADGFLYKEWTDAHGRLVIGFDRNGRVAAKGYGIFPESDDFMNGVRKFFGLR